MTSNSYEEIQICVEDNETEQITIEELLINCVMARPPLWDSRLPIQERSKTVRDQLWLEIYQEFGENTDFSVEYLMKKWRNLRDTYVRLKGEYTPSGSSATKKKKWEFFDMMLFLNDTISFRNTVSNLQSPTPGTSSSSSPMLSPVSNGEERKQKTEKKIEGAIIEALTKINNEPSPQPDINPICTRISDILKEVPMQQRTLLGIKLLQVVYDGAKDYLK